MNDSPFSRLLRLALWLTLAFLFADAIYLASIWPNWERLAKGPLPRSNFMQLYELERQEKGWPRLAWRPVSLKKIPRHVVRAVIVAEDARFYAHKGFDLVAIREAWDYNWAKGRFAFGASTLSQQTTKNLFLTGARTPLRKWHELILTVGLERNLDKNRILEIYLNTAEFGRGIYGIEAAARAYFGVSVGGLSVKQAAELAATLPGPVKHNPRTRTRYFQRHSKKILAHLEKAGTKDKAAPIRVEAPPAYEPPPGEDEEAPPPPSREPRPLDLDVNITPPAEQAREDEAEPAK